MRWARRKAGQDRCAQVHNMARVRCGGRGRARRRVGGFSESCRFGLFCVTQGQ